MMHYVGMQDVYLLRTVARQCSLMGLAMQLIREVIIPNMQHTPEKCTPTQFRPVPFSIPGI